jgi:G3E family GTPase
MIPLTLITGFLGAGKTTFLRHLLAQRAATQHGTLAVIINEFAQIGLDAVQLPDGDYHKWELSRGSIFCICLRTDFIALLERIVREINPDEIWVEATGVADVEEVFKMLSVPTLRTAVYLRTNVCIVDPRTILKVLHTLRAAQQQVTRADVIIHNKIDTADEATLARVEQTLRTHNAHAPILRATQARVALDDLPTFQVPRLDPRHFGGHPPQPITAVAVAEAWTLSRAAFAQWWRAQQHGIWRVKGRLHTPEGDYWVDGTLDEFALRPCADLPTLPAATTLAFVGPKLQRDALMTALRHIAAAP